MTFTTTITIIDDNSSTSETTDTNTNTLTDTITTTRQTLPTRTQTIPTSTIKHESDNENNDSIALPLMVPEFVPTSTIKSSSSETPSTLSTNTNTDTFVLPTESNVIETNNNDNESNFSTIDNNEMSTSLLVGIIVSSLLGVILILVFCRCLYRKKKRGISAPMNTIIPPTMKSVSYYSENCDPVEEQVGFQFQQEPLLESQNSICDSIQQEPIQRFNSIQCYSLPRTHTHPHPDYNYNSMYSEFDNFSIPKAHTRSHVFSNTASQVHYSFVSFDNFRLSQIIIGKEYTVNYSYTASNDDEISLYPGETVKIIDVYSDGWVKGENTLNKDQGVFPSTILVIL